MPEIITRTLHKYVDPESVLPHIRLRPMRHFEASAYYGFHLLQELNPVGTLQMYVGTAEGGRPVSRIESLRIDPIEEAASVRYAAVLSILAMNAQTGSTLVSDEYGSSCDEVSMWYGLEREGLATITEGFVPRLQLLRGEAVWDGRAVAPPVSLQALHARANSVT